MAQLKDTTVNGTLTLNGENVGSKLSGLLSTVEGLKTTYSSELTSLNTKVNNINSKVVFANSNSITLDSFVLDGTTLKNVEFENVGNGIFLSKYTLIRQKMDNLLKISGVIQSNKGVGECDIGKAAATSIEASLRRQFDDSVNLKTYVRTYDGVTHYEKVFLPLECEVHGLIEWSEDKDTLSKYQKWIIPNNKIKAEVNDTSKTMSWLCANKCSSAGYFCSVTSKGNRGYTRSSGEAQGYWGYGMALAFCL